jgi:hypothetical protein
MALFEFAMPLAALTVAGLGIVLLRAEACRIDARHRHPRRPWQVTLPRALAIRAAP